jgi:DNA-binding NarL/FixJ family response regulator
MSGELGCGVAGFARTVLPFVTVSFHVVEHEQVNTMNTAGVRRCRIIVVDSQPIIGKALCHLLAGDRELDIVCDARSLEEAALAVHQPDLLVLDLDGCDGNFDELIASCRATSPATRIIVLTSHVGSAVMQRCLACQVDGYVVKDISPGELMRACKAVARGDNYFDPRVAGGLLRRLTSTHPADDELSLRESEIVRLIAEGLSNKEIGERLNVSDKTVKNHISRIFSKLQVTARTQAAIYAIRNGMV